MKDKEDKISSQKSGYYISKVHLSLVREAERLYCNNLHCSDEVVKMLKPIFIDSDREKVVLISLSACMEPVAFEIISTGGTDSCLVDLKSIFKHVLLSNASYIILAHNHPSQDPTPSEEDDRITERIKRAGELLAITLQDHLIWGDERHYFSYADNNWNQK